MKKKPIKATMLEADFYPEGGDGTYIHITVKAPFDSEVCPGEVTITYDEENTVKAPFDSEWYPGKVTITYDEENNE